MTLLRSISPWKRPPRVKPFDAEEFLRTVEHAGPQLTSGLKGNWVHVGLYIRFFRSPNFEGWLRQRQREMLQKLEVLYLEALCKADILSWIQGKAEEEVVDFLLQIRDKLAGTAGFDQPVSQEIRLELDQHIQAIIATLPSDLQFVLRNS